MNLFIGVIVSTVQKFAISVATSEDAQDKGLEELLTRMDADLRQLAHELAKDWS